MNDVLLDLFGSQLKNNMYKDGILTISDWQKGQANSPYLGFDTMRNVDITSSPGVAKISYRSTLNLTTAGVAVAKVIAKNGDEYILVDTGATSVLYKNGVSLTNVVGVARDMVEYKGYLIISAGTALHCYGTTTSTAYFSNWTPTGFTALDSNNYLKMLVAKSDGYLYITSGSTIRRITTFVAGTFAVAPTAVMDTAITLPDGYYATTFAELGSRLMVGTMNSNQWSLRSRSTEASIFPYRIGVSATAFDDPITISNESCIQQILSNNGLIYITAGAKGNVYASNGTQYNRIRTIPFANRDEFGIAMSYYPNAINVNNRGNLLIGTSSEYGSSENEQHGIYEINLGTGKYECNLINTISTGNYNGTIVIGFVKQEAQDVLTWSWQDGASFGVDRTSIPKYTSYKAVIESPFYIVGSKLSPKKFQYVEILFGKPLTTEQGIKIYYRSDTFSDYTLINTWDYSTMGSVNSIRDKAIMLEKQGYQFKIELTGFSDTGGIPAYDNLELLSVTFW